MCHPTPGKTTRVIERGKCEPSSERHWMDMGEFRVAKAYNSRKRKRIFQRTYQFAPLSTPKMVTLKTHLSSSVI